MTTTNSLVEHIGEDLTKNTQPLTIVPVRANRDWKELNVAFCGDIHLGHHTTPTINTIEGLRAAFSDPVLEGIDLLFLEGDVFDHMLGFPEPEVKLIISWIVHFLKSCKANNVAVRVLEGTPSHDWRQPKIFQYLNDKFVGADMLYVDKCCILYEEQFDIHVLYVPDEWKPTPEETWQDVQDELRIHGLEKVDVACMHGYFPPQLHSKLAYGGHSVENYLSIVRYVLGIGHVHTFWRHEIIVASGSFDRISHGEEAPKGYSECRIFRDEPGRLDVTFKENDLALPYVTVECRGLPRDEAYGLVIATAKKLRPGSHIRIMCKRSDDIAMSLAHWSVEYPHFRWKVELKEKKGEDGEVEQLIELRDLGERPSVINLTNTNIVSSMRNRLLSRMPDKADRLTVRLEELLEAYNDA